MYKNYFPEEIWSEIKLFIFHNIKYGKHLKDDKYIHQYNKILKNIPKPKIPRFGPRIIYRMKSKNLKTYRLLYLLPIKNNFITIIETVKIPNDYHEGRNFIKYDKLITIEYYYQYM
jgi:hypothetical protein